VNSIPIPNVSADTNNATASAASSRQTAKKGGSAKEKPAFDSVLDHTIKDDAGKKDGQETSAGSGQQAPPDGFLPFAVMAISGSALATGAEAKPADSLSTLSTAAAVETSVTAGIQQESAVVKQTGSMLPVQAFVTNESANHSETASRDMADLLSAGSQSGKTAGQISINSQGQAAQSAADAVLSLLQNSGTAANKTAQAAEMAIPLNAMLSGQKMITAVSQNAAAVPDDYQLKAAQTAGVFKASVEPQNTGAVQDEALLATSDADSAKTGAIPVEKTTTAFSGFTANDGKDGALKQGLNTLPNDVPTAGLDKKSTEPALSFSSFINAKQDQPAGAVSSQAAGTAANVPSDPYNVASQIVEQARLIKAPDTSEMVIKLKPEHLGELTLKISVDGGVVNASFHSNNADVRSIIESSLVQLRQDMSSQGLKVDNVGVYAGLGNFFSDGQQRSSQQNAGKTPELKRKNESADFIQAVEAVEAQAQADTTSGVDYKI
jgi:flagellar hook-length control protein FliK